MHAACVLECSDYLFRFADNNGNRQLHAAPTTPSNFPREATNCGGEHVAKKSINQLCYSHYSHRPYPLSKPQHPLASLRSLIKQSSMPTKNGNPLWIAEPLSKLSRNSRVSESGSAAQQPLTPGPAAKRMATLNPRRCDKMTACLRYKLA